MVRFSHSEIPIFQYVSNYYLKTAAASRPLGFDLLSAQYFPHLTVNSTKADHYIPVRSNLSPQ